MKKNEVIKETKMKWTEKLILYVLLILVVTIIGSIMFLRITNVAPTEAAVVVNKIKGVVNEEPIGVGWAVYCPLKTTLVKYTVSARSFPDDVAKSEKSDDYTLDLKTNDGQKINVDLTIIYNLSRKDVPKLHSEIGPDFLNQVVLPQIRSEARIIIGGYPAESIYQGNIRDEIQQKILAKLKASVAKYPAIQIQEALMRHFEFSKEFENAIERKKLASQEVEINKNQALAQEEKAKQQEAEARGLKLQALQQAEGEAQSALIKATAEANSAKVRADAEKYKLVQEAEGNLAKYKAEAEGRRLETEAVGGGENLVALTFAKNLSEKLQIWGIPTGQQSMTIQDLSGTFGGFLKPKTSN